MKTSLLIPLALGGCFISVPAQAGPSNDQVNAMLSYFGWELRAIGGVAPGLGNVSVVGGDTHLVIAGSQVAVLLGGRIMSDLNDFQVAAFDAGGRYFLRPQANVGLFVGGGGFYGVECVDELAFAIGHGGGVYAEGGVQLPRTWAARVTASVRVDLGYTAKSEFSRIEPPPFFSMFSVNVGFFFGGAGTRAESASADL